ncbi:MAG: hypothetical protein ACHQ53_05690 [Polyangiales bacterium]
MRCATGAGALALMLAAIVPCSKAAACECPSLTPLEAYEQADAVFEGRVIEVAQARGDVEGVHRVRLSVVRAWKGVRDETVELLAAPACGSELTANESYFVYASAQGGKLALGECSRTRPMPQADEDLRALGMGVTTFDPKAGGHVPAASSAKREPPARGGCASCAAVGHGRPATPLTVALLLLLGLSFRKFGSRS